MGIDKNKSQLTTAAELRRHAEERLRAKSAELHSPCNEEQVKRLVHELEVHQIELEIQNAELRQARDETEAALEKYADLYDFAPVGYFTLDHEGIIRSVNLTGASLLGIERSRLLGRRCELFVADETRPFFAEFLEKVFTNQAKAVCEVALLKKGNSPFFVQIEGVAAASGQECRIALIDISERKRGEEVLRESEERLRLLIDGAKDYAIFMLDAEGNVTSWNEGAQRLKGWEAEEILGCYFSRFYPEEAIAAGRPAQELQIAVSDGSYKEEGVRVRKDGVEFYADVSITAIHDQNGKLRGFAKVTRDITDHKRDEDALRKAHDELEQRVLERTQELSVAHEAVNSGQQRLFGVLETLPVCVVLLTQDYHVPFANRFFRERFGESGGRRCYEYLFNRTEPCEICETYRVLKTNAPHRWEWTGPDGCNYDIYNYPFVDTDGSPLILEMRIDITERRQAETELKELNETLEERIIERTAQLNSAFEKLRASRVAALNLMEDAVIARRAAEETSDKLLLEIVERKRAEEATACRNALLTAINSIFKEAFTCETEEELAEACLKIAEEITESKFGFIDEIGPDGILHDIAISNPGWEICTVYDASGNRKAPGNFHVRGIYGQVVKEGKGFYTNDPSTHPDSIGLPPGHPPLTSFLGVPLKRGGNTIGLIAIGNRDGGYRDEDLESLEALAPVIVEAFQRKRSEQALRESELFYSQTLESIPGMVFTTRPDGYCDYQNRQWVEFTGVPMVEHLGDGWNRLLHPDDRPRAFAAWQAAVEGRAPYNLEYRVRRNDGEYEWFKVIGRPIRDAAGKIVKWFGVAANIDAIKRGEKELLQTKEAAEVASRAKSQFLANMSHELRTPMTGVLGMLEITLSGALDKDQRNFIELADRSARSLLQILNDILDLTKIEAGMLTMEEKPIDLRECVISVIDILLPEARRKGLSLLHAMPVKPLEKVVGDPLRLRQILTNLVGNAVKFTEKGKVEVTVQRGKKMSDGRRQLTFSVTDTGIGIPADKRDILFNVFTQADESHTRRFGGTGLGLAICRELVERMGGTITFESTLGVGSSFSFTMPFLEAGPESVTAAEPVPVPAVEGTVSPGVDGEKFRLLVAEDDAITRKILGLMLQRAGFDFEFAGDGRQAVEMWQQGEYDLVVMDGQMPFMDGFAAAATIRELERERGGHIPIVAMTAHALTEDEDRCLSAGMDAYISKPIDVRKSIDLITQLIARCRDPRHQDD